MPDNRNPSHSICIEERVRMLVTGVEDVDCFSENTAVITTSMGAITIAGSSLKVARLDLQAGEVAMEGEIDVIEYGSVRKNGLLARIFR